MKRLISVFTLLVLVLSIAACGGMQSTEKNVQKEDKPVIAFCMNQIAHPVHRLMQLGFADAAKKMGYDNYIISGTAKGTNEECMDQWETDVAEYNVAAVVVWEVSEECYGLLQRWHENGIKIIALSSSVGYDETSGFIDANLVRDDKAIAAAASDYIVNALKAKGITEGEIGVSQSMASQSAYFDTFFKNRMEELDTDFTILETAYEDAMPDEASITVSKYIAKSPDIVAAAGFTEISAFVWSVAKQSSNRSELVVICTDCAQASLNALDEGGVDALIGVSLYDFGYDSVCLLDQLLKGEVLAGVENWQEPLEFYTITANGKGKNGISRYRELYTRCAEAFDEYNDYYLD